MPGAIIDGETHNPERRCELDCIQSSPRSHANQEIPCRHVVGKITCRALWDVSSVGNPHHAKGSTGECERINQTTPTDITGE